MMGTHYFRASGGWRSSTELITANIFMFWKWSLPPTEKVKIGPVTLPKFFMVNGTLPFFQAIFKLVTKFSIF